MERLNKLGILKLQYDLIREEIQKLMYKENIRNFRMDPMKEKGTFIIGFYDEEGNCDDELFLDYKAMTKPNESTRDTWNHMVLAIGGFILDESGHEAEKGNRDKADTYQKLAFQVKGIVEEDHDFYSIGEFLDRIEQGDNDFINEIIDFNEVTCIDEGDFEIGSLFDGPKSLKQYILNCFKAIYKNNFEEFVRFVATRKDEDGALALTYSTWPNLDYDELNAASEEDLKALFDKKLERQSNKEEYLNRVLDHTRCDFVMRVLENLEGSLKEQFMRACGIHDYETEVILPARFIETVRDKSIHCLGIPKMEEEDIIKSIESLKQLLNTIAIPEYQKEKEELLQKVFSCKGLQDE